MKKYLIIFCSILFYSCGDNIKPTVLDKANYNYPEQESWNSVVIFSDSGITRAVLSAGHLMRFEGSSKTLIDQNMKVDFFDLNGEKTSTLTANSGWADESADDLFASGNVKIVSTNNVTIETEEINWKNSTQKIYSEKFVKIISPTEKLQGFGFESDQHLSNYKIYKVSGTSTNEKGF